MFGRHLLWIGSATSALCFASIQPAMARGGAGPGISDSDAIVVTARRLEENLQDVPISISVFDQATLDKRNIVNSGDLAIYTPSLSINKRYGPEKASFIIRGFVQDLATQPSVGVYFNDVVAPRSGGQTTSGGGVGVGDMFDLQNTQILKGPQGTLFGRNTTGGAVLLVPRKPTDRLEGYVEGSLGDYDMWRLQGVLNLPVSDTFKVRLGVDKMKRDGYLRNHSGVGPGRLGDVDYISARLGIVANLTPDLENYFLARYALSENNGIVPHMVGCNTNPSPSAAANAAMACAQIARAEARGDGWWDVENNQPNPLVRMETWQVINTTTWNVSDNLTVKNIVSYAEFREKTRTSLQGDNLLNPDGSFAKFQISLNNTPGHHNAIQNTYTEELQLQGKALNGDLTWQVGGYFENSDPLGYTSQSTIIGLNCDSLADLTCKAAPAIALPGAGNVFISTISQPFQKTWFRNRGLYAQATYDVTQALSLTGGFRYTWDTMRHQYNGAAIGFPADNTPFYFCSNTVRVRYPEGVDSPSNPGYNFPVVSNSYTHEECAITFEAKSNKPTWLIDIDYKPTPDLLVYAKYARGYRAGGAAGANIYFETWRPEKVDNYEIGQKFSFRGGNMRGYFNSAVFYNDFSDQQIQATLQRAATSPLLGGSAIINAGKSRIWGVEVDSSVTAFDIFRADVGYTYLNTKLKELDPNSYALTPEQQLVWAAAVPTANPLMHGGMISLSPRHRLTLTGTFMLPVDDSIGQISLSATYVYTSKQLLTNASAPQFQMAPSSNLLNLNANWNNIMGAPIDFAFFMTNVTNEKIPLAMSNAWNSYGYESAVVNEPRMFGFRLKYRFGN